MILKELRLHNIRSYISEIIKFPKGSVLLSGDIGSGKSSVLLGIEFALFGILRGDISGSTLLRHGENKGSVQLTFDLNGAEIIISRSLKRSKTGITQDSGFIVKDGLLKKATAIELKSEIIALLGYPEDLLTKSKNLIYRFTVYTPQEQMKAILFENSETRLSILRKLFQIDKYQRIRENLTVYLRNLKNKIKYFEGECKDLKQKQEEFTTFKSKIQEITDKLEIISPKLDSQRLFVKNKKIELITADEKIKELYQLRQEFSLCESQQRNFINQISRYKQEFIQLEEEINTIEFELKDKDFDEKEVSNSLSKKQEEISLFEKNLKTLTQSIAEINLQKKQSTDLKQKIENLDNCPMCLQEVSHKHKKGIFDKEEEKLKLLADKFEDIRLENEELESKLRISKSEHDELIRREKEIAVKLTKLKSLTNYIKRREQINEFLSSAKKNVGEMNIKKLDLTSKIDSFKNAEENLNKSKKDLDLLVQLERRLEIEFSQLSREKQSFLSFSKNIESEIKRKEFTKKKMLEFIQIHSWLSDFFIPVTRVIEKQVFTKVFHQFNSFFESWFSLLMEDENISARLDATFSPILVQNGYETSVNNLSGGEKTACALAYRLALNKVINDFISNIQTKDLLILDEPTDGFSTEQLDKIRDVLEQLGGKQTIIVSHEHKIESFVESVLKVSKIDHISKVV